MRRASTAFLLRQPQTLSHDPVRLADLRRPSPLAYCTFATRQKRERASTTPAAASDGGFRPQVCRVSSVVGVVAPPDPANPLHAAEFDACAVAASSPLLAACAACAVSCARARSSPFLLRFAASATAAAPACKRHRVIHKRHLVRGLCGDRVGFKAWGWALRLGAGLLGTGLGVGAASFG